MYFNPSPIFCLPCCNRSNAFNFAVVHIFLHPFQYCFSFIFNFLQYSEVFVLYIPLFPCYSFLYIHLSEYSSSSTLLSPPCFPLSSNLYFGRISRFLHAISSTFLVSLESRVDANYPSPLQLFPSIASPSVALFLCNSGRGIHLLTKLSVPYSEAFRGSHTHIWQGFGRVSEHFHGRFMSLMVVWRSFCAIHVISTREKLIYLLFGALEIVQLRAESFQEYPLIFLPLDDVLS